MVQKVVETILLVHSATLTPDPLISPLQMMDLHFIPVAVDNVCIDMLRCLNMSMKL